MFLGFGRIVKICKKSEKTVKFGGKWTLEKYFLLVVWPNFGFKFKITKKN